MEKFAAQRDTSGAKLAGEINSGEIIYFHGFAPRGIKLLNISRLELFAH